MKSKYIRVLLALVLVVGLAFFLSAPTVHAQAVKDFTGTSAKGLIGLDIKNLVSKLAIVNTFLHVLILISLNFVEYLLQSDFLTNPAMMTSLNRIWQLSRDIMNVIFAIMLIGVALYTIVTADKKFVTDKLKNFVMAVILVNLSWFFPRVIIDVANVLTATVYTVPDMMTGGFECKTWNIDGDPVEPCSAIIALKILPIQPSKENGFKPDPFCSEAPIVPASDCHCSGIACYKKGSLAALKASGNAGAGHVMINGLVVNFIKILDLPKIASSVAGITPTTSSGFMQSMQILMVIGMAFIFQIALVLPLIGLAVGLLIRILILWVTTAFMPFAFLGVVVNGKLGPGPFDYGFDIWKEFITAAFMPVMVAVPISVGFIMITTVTQVPAPLDAFPLGFGIPMFVGVRTWWVMLWQVAAIMVVWTGTFAALSKSKFIGKFTDKLKSTGEGLFGTALKLPLITPIPVPGAGNLGGLLNAPRKFASAVNLSATEGTPFGTTVRNKFKPGGTGRGTTIDGAADLLNRTENKNNTQQIVDAIGRLKGVADPTARSVIINEIKTKLEMSDLGTNVEVMKRLNDIVTQNKLADGSVAKTLFNDDVKKTIKDTLIAEGGTP